MKNKEITIYELIGLIENDKAPEKIKFKNNIYEYDIVTMDYFSEKDERPFLGYLFCDVIHPLYLTVEILTEENDDWEDIENVKLYGKDIKYGSLEEWLDFTPNDNDQKICSCIETLAIVMNKIIKNQKHLKKKLEVDKDE